MVRTQEEIKRQIKGIRSMKKTLGKANFEHFALMIEVLKGNEQSSHYDDVEEELLHQSALDAENWLNGSIKEDLFD